MDKKIFLIFLILILFCISVFAVDIVIPSNPNNPIPSEEQIQQIQAITQQFNVLQEQINSLSTHFDDRTNLLANFVDSSLKQTTSNLIIFSIIINLCTIGLVLGLILFLKAKRVW